MIIFFGLVCFQLLSYGLAKTLVSVAYFTIDYGFLPEQYIAGKPNLEKLNFIISPRYAINIEFAS